jgi:hypothetical protein
MMGLEISVGTMSRSELGNEVFEVKLSSRRPPAFLGDQNGVWEGDHQAFGGDALRESPDSLLVGNREPLPALADRGCAEGMMISIVDAAGVRRQFGKSFRA